MALDSAGNQQGTASKLQQTFVEMTIFFLTTIITTRTTDTFFMKEAQTCCLHNERYTCLHKKFVQLHCLPLPY